MLSVIVPIFRVEKYLDKCVQSILAQTYKDLEIILVDDGSDDGCPVMCDAYAKTHSRIRVVHKKAALNDRNDLREKMKYFLTKEEWEYTACASRSLEHMVYHDKEEVLS